MTVFASMLLLSSALLGFILLRKYSNSRSSVGFIFTCVWMLHYVFGCAIILFSGGKVFGIAAIESYQDTFLIAQLVGIYFIFIFTFLLGNGHRYVVTHYQYRRNSGWIIFGFYFLSLIFFALLILRIGPSSFFSPELALYRAVLGDYAGEGIGYYYYLAMLIIPSTILFLHYLSTRTSKFSTVVCMILVLGAAALLLSPLGGRGRLVNIFVILFLASFFSNPDKLLPRLLNIKTLSFFGLVISLVVVWGFFREIGNVGEDFSAATIFRSLSVDSTRLYIQAFIFKEFSIFGDIHGSHYMSSVIGPFREFIMLDDPNLVGEMSNRWFLKTVGILNPGSALSPSLIGEAYLTFGIIGVLISPFVYFYIITSLCRMQFFRHPLILSMTIYFLLFGVFNGGAYAMFDVLLIFLPAVFVLNSCVVHRGKIV